MNSVCSCGLELEKRGREVPNVANSEEEISSMAYLSVSPFNYSSNDAEEGQTNKPPLVPPLALKVQTDGNLRESKENLEKCIQTDDWLGHCMDDEVDGAMKNVWGESSAIQNCIPCYSSTGSAEPPFQGEGGVTDNLPRITDQVERQNRESVTYWNDKDTKPKKIRPRDDMRNTIDKKESNFFGLRPYFLARHSEDSSITIPIDDIGNTAENANGGSSNTFSRNQGSSCLTNEQDYQDYSFQAPSFRSESSKVSAHVKGPNPYGSFDPNPAVWDLPVPARPLISLPCNRSEHLQTLSCDDPRIVPPHALRNGDTPLKQTPLLTQQRKVKDQRTDPEVQRKRNYDFKVMNRNPAFLSNTTSITQGLVSPEMELSALPQAAMNSNLTWETRTLADQDTANQEPPSLSNDDFLADLERRVAETCSLVEKTLKKREVKEKAMKEKERRKKEERARKEQQARERREREASVTRQTERRNYREEVSNPTSGGGETPTQTSAGAEGRQWLCEHYKRLCRVKFPCCGKFFPCHRCHNNSGCPNDNSKAREACYVECSVCSHQQEVFRHIFYLKFHKCEKGEVTFRLYAISF